MVPRLGDGDPSFPVHPVGLDVMCVRVQRLYVYTYEVRYVTVYGALRLLFQ